MSEFSTRSPDKGGGSSSSSTIGFRFHTRSEELADLLEPINYKECTNFHLNPDLTTKPTLVSSSSLDAVKCDLDKRETHGETVKDYWGMLGRSVSVDSSYQSPFSNPLETWRKLNELKGKITKTVEEKISEMKMDHNVSSHFKMNSSKENSSVSDSEDNSEGFKMSDQWKDAEDLNMSLKEVINKTTDMLTNTLDAALQNAKSELEAETELRHRKSRTRFSDLMKISDIKIATAKSELDDSLTDDNVTEDIESGVEAEENLDSTSLDAFDDPSVQQLPVGGSQMPPGGSDMVSGYLNYFYSLTVSEMYAVVFLVGWVLYLVIPMSDFVRGFVFCLLFMCLFFKLKSYFLKDDSYLQQGAFVMPDFNSLPPLKVPEYEPVKGVWINEYEREVYDPDYYSVSQTVPAYLELENCILKLSRPKGKINKRATYDEPDYKLQFLNQRVYNISGCNVFLMPEGLTRKRLYSKKYPIVIFLRPDSFVGEKNMEERDNAEVVETEDLNLISTSSEKKSSLYLFTRCDRQKEEWYRKLLTATRLSQTPVHEDNKITEENENDKKQSHHHEHGNHKVRDTPKKQGADEYVKVAEASTPFESIFFDPETSQMEEYLRYMAKFVDIESHPAEPKTMKSPESNNVGNKKNKKKKGAELECAGQEENVERVYSVSNEKKSKVSRFSRLKVHEEPEIEEPLPKLGSAQIQWFSAFVNRILFDMFRSPYWLAKIHEKLYKKLNSIRLPYYVEDIEVIEMDLGKTGPVFHRVSQPYLDERGLWFDMDTTFDGLVKLTIQTHLNLVKLQKGMQEEEALKQVLEKPEKHKKKAKEVKDSLLIKDSHQKSKETVYPSKSNKKLEKASLRSKPSYVQSDDLRKSPIPENDESNVNLKSEKSSDLKLLNEVARIAEIALEGGSDDLSQSELHEEAEISNSYMFKERRRSKSPIYDSEVEDSAESSDDDIEEEEEMAQIQAPTEAEENPTPVSIVRRYPKNRRSSKKLFRMFENVAQSKYFKSVAQSKYIQKAIAGVSATKLKLSLEIKSVSGTLAINIPPPPSDRFWYGFRDMPKLIFSANPKIGEKSVRFSQIKNYLQRKILHEIKKAMVVPNMIDFALPTSVPSQSPSSQQMEETTVTADQDRESTTPEQDLKKSINTSA